jgi:DNA-binding transcriptional LysR family regulator
MFDWDDLRFFLVAAKAGSLIAAGQNLGRDAGTVGRRIARLESALKSTLFVRSANGLQLTAAGSQLLETGLEAEAAMKLAGRITQPDLVAGVVRISSAEGFGTTLLAPALPTLSDSRPGLRVELAAHAGFLSASRREVDMAITLSPPAAHRLAIEPLTKYQLALYAAPTYIARAGQPKSIDELPSFALVGYIDDLIYAPELQYLDEIRPGLRPKLASSSLQAQRAMVEAGGGIGVLPCFLAGGLSRILAAEVLIERRFWLSTNLEIHKTARMRAVRSWLFDLVRASENILSPYRE